jgi:hypothetical protein
MPKERFAPDWVTTETCPEIGLGLQDESKAHEAIIVAMSKLDVFTISCD